MTIQNVSRHCQMFPGGENCPHWGFTDLENKVLHQFCFNHFFFLINGKGVRTKQWKLVLESTSTEVTWTLVPNATGSQLLRQEDDQSLSPFLLHRVLWGILCRDIFRLQVQEVVIPELQQVFLCSLTEKKHEGLLNPLSCFAFGHCLEVEGKF